MSLRPANEIPEKRSLTQMLDTIPWKDKGPRPYDPEGKGVTLQLLVSEMGGICQVCGDGGAEMRYRALVCPACSWFFAWIHERGVTLKNFEHNVVCKDPTDWGHCQLRMVQANRMESCNYCRIKKCFEVGMKFAPVKRKKDRSDPSFMPEPLCLVVRQDGVDGKNGKRAKCA